MNIQDQIAEEKCHARANLSYARAEMNAGEYDTALKCAEAFVFHVKNLKALTAPKKDPHAD